MTETLQTSRTLNGIDVLSLKQLPEGVAQGRHSGIVKFGVSTQWRGGTTSETRVTGYDFSGPHVKRNFSIHSDEPYEILGSNQHPNPQELLMAGFNACMTVGYVVGATARGIELESISIETEGELDMRGFLGLDAKVKPGYDTLHYTVRIKGDGTAEQFREIHEEVIRTSPNRFNIANPIRLTADLVVE
ncbi:MAG TPA: OsmC family protein [Tepidisphaeraceae bacterium]|jgi:uncharacterized OsmC-like protein